MLQQIYYVSLLYAHLRFVKLMGSISVLIIPFHILWRIQINLRQKLILGATLSLSIFMIILAIIRISKIRADKETADIIWVIFWQQIEASTAVIMISLSAFRTFFVARESRLRHDRNRHRQWYMDRKNQIASALRRKKFRSASGSGCGSEELNHLVAIPRATMTGMRTFINGGGGEPNDENHLSSRGGENAEKIRVEQRIEITSIGSDQVRQSLS